MCAYGAGMGGGQPYVEQQGYKGHNGAVIRSGDTVALAVNPIREGSMTREQMEKRGKSLRSQLDKANPNRGTVTTGGSNPDKWGQRPTAGGERLGGATVLGG